MRHFLKILSLIVGLQGGLALADQKDPELDRLFAQLHVIDNRYEAAVITNRIWSLWREYDSDEIIRLMKLGVRRLEQSRFDEAIAYFTEIVQRAPDFAEGWNIRATAYYMMGEYALSTQDVMQTLALEPRHFGALSGQGLIYLQLNNHAAALKYMEKALEYNPHMANVRKNIEFVKRQLQKELI